MAIDWNRPVETDEAYPRPVRVLGRNEADSGHPIVLIVDVSGYYVSSPTGDSVLYLMDGGEPMALRFRNVYQQSALRHGWVNLYPTKHLAGRIGEAGDIFPDEASCRMAAVDGCAATIRVEWEEVS